MLQQNFSAVDIALGYNDATQFGSCNRDATSTCVTSSMCLTDVTPAMRAIIDITTSVPDTTVIYDLDCLESSIYNLYSSF